MGLLEGGVAGQFWNSSNRPSLETTTTEWGAWISLIKCDPIAAYN
jgi:hypothetical protein